MNCLRCGYYKKSDSPYAGAAGIPVGRCGVRLPPQLAALVGNRNIDAIAEPETNRCALWAQKGD